MSDRPEIMNQAETAEYISDNGIPMKPADLSRLTKFGAGPDFEPKGGQKIFHRVDVDAWISKEKRRRDEPDTNDRPQL